MDKATVDVQTDITGESFALGMARVEGEGGTVVWAVDSEEGVEAVRDTGRGGGEEDKEVGASELDCIA